MIRQLVLVCLLANPTAITAQAIAGQVRDAAGQPVAYALLGALRQSVGLYTDDRLDPAFRAEFEVVD